MTFGFLMVRMVKTCGFLVVRMVLTFGFLLARMVLAFGFLGSPRFCSKPLWNRFFSTQLYTAHGQTSSSRHTGSSRQTRSSWQKGPLQANRDPPGKRELFCLHNPGVLRAFRLPGGAFAWRIPVCLEDPVCLELVRPLGARPFAWRGPFALLRLVQGSSRQTGSSGQPGSSRQTGILQ